MASDDTGTYDSIVDVHLYTGCLSFVGGFLVLGMFWWDKRLRQEQLGKMVQIITICDLLYTVKFVAGAVSWHMGLRDERDSFHIFPDNCLSSAVYGMLLSTAIVAWNACWLVDLVITITRPLSSTRKHMVWYHIFVWSASVGTAVYVWATGVPAQSADHTCWVRAGSANLVLFDFIVGLYLVLAVGSLLFALRATLFAGTRMTRSLRAAIFWRHFTYVATFAFMWAWPFVHHFLEDTMWVTYVDAFTVSGQAFALSLIRLREPGAAAAMVEMLGALGRECVRRLVAAATCRCRRACCGRDHERCRRRCRRRLRRLRKRCSCTLCGPARRGGHKVSLAAVGDYEAIGGGTDGVGGPATRRDGHGRARAGSQDSSGGSHGSHSSHSSRNSSSSGSSSSSDDDEPPRRHARSASTRQPQQQPHNSRLIAEGIARARSSMRLEGARFGGGGWRRGLPVRADSFLRSRQSFAAGLAPPASPMAAATGEQDAPGWGPSLSGVSLPEIEFGKALGSSQAPSLRGRARGERQARSQAGRGTGDEADSSDDSSDWASLGAPERVNWPGLSGEASAVALLSAAAASEAGADGDGSEGGQDADEIDAAAELAAVRRAAGLLRSGGLAAWRGADERRGAASPRRAAGEGRPCAPADAPAGEGAMGASKLATRSTLPQRPGRAGLRQPGRSSSRAFSRAGDLLAAPGTSAANAALAASRAAVAAAGGQLHWGEAASAASPRTSLLGGGGGGYGSFTEARGPAPAPSRPLPFKAGPAVAPALPAGAPPPSHAAIEASLVCKTSDHGEASVGAGGQRALGAVPLTAAGSASRRPLGRSVPPAPPSRRASDAPGPAPSAAGTDAARRAGEADALPQPEAGPDAPAWMVWPRPSRATSVPRGGWAALSLGESSAATGSARPGKQASRAPADRAPHSPGSPPPHRRLRIVATHTPLVRSSIVRLRSNSASEFAPGCANPFIEDLITAAAAPLGWSAPRAVGEQEAALAARRAAVAGHGGCPLLLPAPNLPASLVSRAQPTPAGSWVLAGVDLAFGDDGDDDDDHPASPAQTWAAVAAAAASQASAEAEATEAALDSLGGWPGGRSAPAASDRRGAQGTDAGQPVTGDAGFSDDSEEEGERVGAWMTTPHRGSAQPKAGWVRDRMRTLSGAPAAQPRAKGGLPGQPGQRATPGRSKLSQETPFPDEKSGPTDSRASAAAAAAMAGMKRPESPKPLQGFDVGATLRRELSLCVLSGLCQTVLVAELDYGLAKDAAARRGPAHKEAPCVSLALGDSALSSGGRLASGQSFGPGSTTSIGKESAGPSSAAAQGAAPASGAGGASGWWGTESLGRAGDGSAVIPGPLPPPEKVESFAELLKRPATARRRFSMLSNFSSKKFQRAARKVAHAAAVKAAEDDALLAASSSGRFRSRRRQKRRRALSTRYKPPLGSLVSMTLNGSMAGAGRAAGVPILVEGEDSTTSGEDSERGARRSLGHRGSRSHKSHTAKASRAGRAGETGTLQHPGRGRGSGSPAAAAPGGLGQRSDSTDSSMHLDEPLLLGAGADGRGSFSRQSSGSSVDEGGSPLLSSDPPRVRVFTAAPRRSDRRRSSVMDEFQVQSIEDEAFAKLRARMGIGGVQLASAFDPALMQEGKLRAHFSHGASRSFFCRSVNDDIILKTIERDEVEALASLLPAYLKHLDVNPDSLLCRFLALIVVHVRGVGPLYCLVMQNSFPFGNLGMQSVVFDLKGSTVGRRSKPAGDDSHGAKKGKAKPKGALRLDQDFREMAPKGVPLASPRLTSEIVSQVIRDVTLLGTYGLMDYSCLLAISPVPDGCRAQVQSAGPAPLNAGGPPRRWSSFSAVVSEIPEWRPDPSVPARKSVQVVVQIGIVDLLQQYDLGKKIEHRFKQLMRLGRSADVSAVPAERYASRFSDFVANVLQGCDIALKPAKGPTG